MTTRFGLECMELCLHILFGVRCSGIWAESADPPAVWKHFCPSALSLLPYHFRIDRFKTNSEEPMFGNSVWHSCWQVCGFISV